MNPVRPDLRNIFIVTMENVISAGDAGMSYNQMIDILKSHNQEPKGDSIQYYKVWFFRTFFVDKLHPSVNRDFEWNYSSNPGMLDQNANKPAVITAQAAFDYMEYIEIKEARESSQLAKKYAIAAIIVSAAFALIQILIAISQSHCS